jgi:serine/threonine-protein kinase
MGDVWRGTDLAIDRRVAIKLLRSERADDEDGLARFRAEAHHAGSLSHPNIAQVFDYGEARAAEPGYLVMELVEGLSLTRILDDGPLPPGDVMDVVAQAARGLAAAHRAGLVHRDIKPGNLLVRLDGLVKITDFGIAHAAGETPVTQPVTQPGMLIGTPAYLAPERISGLPGTPATDLYGLGVVAHQCLTGKVPFAGEPLAVALAHLDRGIPPLPPSVPPAVAALVTDLTRQDPAARPGSAWDVAVRADHLRVILSGAEAPSLGGAAASPGRADGAGLASPSVAGRVVAGAAVAGAAVAGAAVAGPAVAGPGMAGPGVAGPAPGAAAGDGPAAWPPPQPPPRPRPQSRGRRGRRPRRRGPARSKASLPVRGALVLTGVASVGFIGWTLATLPSPVAANPPSVAPPASSQSPTPGLLPQQSPVAAARAAGANGGNADVAGATATPQVPGLGGPHRSGSPTPTTPVPTTPVPTTPVPTTPVPTTPVPTTPVPTTPVPTTPVPTTPVPTTTVPTAPIGSLTPSAGPADPASISVSLAQPGLVSVQIVP